MMNISALKSLPISPNHVIWVVFVFMLRNKIYGTLSGPYAKVRFSHIKLFSNRKYV